MKLLYGYLLSAVAICVPAAAQTIAPSCALFPGWTQDGPERSYEGDSLFEYMNGNSEGYYAYGFVQMKGVTCVRGGDKVIVDVSEMATPEMAYGMFTANRDPGAKVEAIGSGGQIVPRKLIFAKGKYYCEITAEPDKDHTATLSSMAAALSEAVKGDAYAPAEVGWFPREGMTTGSARLVPQSVLGIGLLKRGYIALYGPAKAFVVTEESPAAARAVFAKLRARFGSTEPVPLADEGFRANDRYLGALCVFLKANRIGGFANVPAGEDAAALAKGIADRLP